MLLEFKPTYSLLLPREKSKSKELVEFWNCVLEGCIQKRGGITWDFLIF